MRPAGLGFIVLLRGLPPSGSVLGKAQGRDEGSHVLTYSRAKGLFAGMSLSGASLEPDSDANQCLYGKSASASDIVLANEVKVTPGGKSLVSLLYSNVARHKD